MITFIEYNNVGAIADEAAVSVGNSSATYYDIPVGKKGVSLQNVGGKIIWYGGSSVDPSNNRGNKLFPNQTLIYKNVKSAFRIYFLCGGTDTSTMGVVNHD